MTRCFNKIQQFHGYLIEITSFTSALIFRLGLADSIRCVPSEYLTKHGARKANFSIVRLSLDISEKPRLAASLPVCFPLLVDSSSQQEPSILVPPELGSTGSHPGYGARACEPGKSPHYGQV